MRLPPPCKNRIAALCRILFAHSIPARIITTAIENCKREIQKDRKVVQSEATGFINIYGLPTKVQAIVNKEKEGN